MFLSFGFPKLFSLKTRQNLINTSYPLNLAQNIITTGLIIYRLWRQHRESSAAGVQSLELPLVTMIRIIVESALLYTTELLLLLVLGADGSNGKYFMRYLLIPTIGLSTHFCTVLAFKLFLDSGIVFNLMSVRVHMAQLRSPPSLTRTLQGLSNWLEDHELEPFRAARADSHSYPSELDRSSGESIQLQIIKQSESV
jgi:hypothetical protein